MTFTVKDFNKNDIVKAVYSVEVHFITDFFYRGFETLEEAGKVFDLLTTFYGNGFAIYLNKSHVHKKGYIAKEEIYKSCRMPHEDQPPSIEIREIELTGECDLCAKEFVGQNLIYMNGECICKRCFPKRYNRLAINFA
jgi:formylmethanofuran dehydrogenase subunit E